MTSELQKQMEELVKPREFWLHQSGDDKKWYVVDHIGSHDFDLHVVEVGPMLVMLSKFQSRIERLEKANRVMKLGLEWYAAIGNNDDTRLEECLEKAMIDRPDDKTTINLGGKYVARKAIKSLSEADKIMNEEPVDHGNGD